MVVAGVAGEGAWVYAPLLLAALTPPSIPPRRGGGKRFADAKRGGAYPAPPPLNLPMRGEEKDSRPLRFAKRQADLV